MVALKQVSSCYFSNSEQFKGFLSVKTWIYGGTKFRSGLSRGPHLLPLTRTSRHPPPAAFPAAVAPLPRKPYPGFSQASFLPVSGLPGAQMSPLAEMCLVQTSHLLSLIPLHSLTLSHYTSQYTHQYPFQTRRQQPFSTKGKTVYMLGFAVLQSCHNHPILLL